MSVESSSALPYPTFGPGSPGASIPIEPERRFNGKLTQGSANKFHVSPREMVPRSYASAITWPATSTLSRYCRSQQNGFFVTKRHLQRNGACPNADGARFGVVMKAGLPVFLRGPATKHGSRIIVYSKAAACPRTVYMWPCQYVLVLPKGNGAMA